jgi:hypothetical protein
LLALEKIEAEKERAREEVKAKREKQSEYAGKGQTVTPTPPIEKETKVTGFAQTGFRGGLPTETEYKYKEGYIFDPIAGGYVSPKKEKVSLQKGTKKFTVDGKPWGQDYNFNPTTGERTFVGEPYPMDKAAGVTINMPKATPQGQLESLNKLYAFDSQLDRIEENWDKMFTGPIEGRIGWIRDLTGLDLGLPDEKASKQAIFRQVVKDIGDTLLRLRSGAQINEQEYQRLLKLLPTPNLPDRTFKARLQSLRKAIQNNISIRRQMLGGQYKVPVEPVIETTPSDKMTPEQEADAYMKN